MSIVVAAAFPDFGLLMSDSRITTGNGTVKRDELQKIYQLGRQLAVGFTSNDVRISYGIIREMTRYSSTVSRTQHTSYLLSKLPRVANFYYKKYTNGLHRPPSMDFSYVGVVNDYGARVPVGPVFDLIKRFKNSFILSPEMQRALFTAKDGIMTFMPPTVLVLIQKFPENNINSFNALGISLCGSGSGAFIELEKEIEKVLLSPHKELRTYMIQLTIEDYCKKNHITTVGGMTQIVVVDSKGVSPRSYTMNSFSQDGKTISGKKMEYRSDGWVQVDLKTGKEIRVQHFNPLMFQDSNNEFEALGGVSS